MVYTLLFNSKYRFLNFKIPTYMDLWKELPEQRGRQKIIYFQEIFSDVYQSKNHVNGKLDDEG